MTAKMTGCLVGTLIALGAAGSAQSVSVGSLGPFTTIDYPGATNTFPLDINASGVIVGRYLMAGRTHGFLRSAAGDLSTIDVPGALLTVAAAINDEGAVVGQYSLPGAPAARHGFLLQDGQFTTFDPPGSIFTNALGINERGDIVGRYCTASCGLPGTGSFHAFLLQDGAYASLDVAGAIESDAFGISGSETVAGGVLGADHHERVFVLSNGALTTIAPPGGQPISLDKGGINERGEIVGVYCDAAVPCVIMAIGTHGFLINDDGFTPIDIPGATATAAIGINARGDIAGSYFDAHGAHGFLISRGGN